MSDKTHRIIEAVAASVDIPEMAYDKAEARYKDLAAWFGRPEAVCYQYDPHVYPQGSFRLGTVVAGEEYDLDFGCRLRNGVSKSTHTQKQLKGFVGADMESYRQARRIESTLKEKPRCWRLQYQEDSGFKFHMDGVPSIPMEDPHRQLLAEAMIKAGRADFLAQAVAKHAGSITDNRLPNYEVISPDWRISNSEGYALWFESRIKLGIPLLEERALEARAAKVDDLPVRRSKSPLQRCVQALKCHRDVMFADDPDSKPISVIITTLAAEAYQGEQDVGSAMQNILATMGNYVNRVKPRVPNPVNPAEDFADKWYDPAYQHLNLEQNFWQWLEQAQNDFQVIGESRDADFIAEQVQSKFGATIDAKSLKDKIGLGTISVITSPKSHTIVEAPRKTVDAQVNNGSSENTRNARVPSRLSADGRQAIGGAGLAFEGKLRFRGASSKRRGHPGFVCVGSSRSTRLSKRTAARDRDRKAHTSHRRISRQSDGQFPLPGFSTFSFVETLSKANAQWIRRRLSRSISLRDFSQAEDWRSTAVWRTRPRRGRTVCRLLAVVRPEDEGTTDLRIQVARDEEAPGQQTAVPLRVRNSAGTLQIQLSAAGVPQSCKPNLVQITSQIDDNG